MKIYFARILKLTFLLGLFGFAGAQTASLETCLRNKNCDSIRWSYGIKSLSLDHDKIRENMSAALADIGKQLQGKSSFRDIIKNKDMQSFDLLRSVDKTKGFTYVHTSDSVIKVVPEETSRFILVTYNQYLGVGYIHAFKNVISDSKNSSQRYARIKPSDIKFLSRMQGTGKEREIFLNRINFYSKYDSSRLPANYLNSDKKIKDEYSFNDMSLAGMVVLAGQLAEYLRAQKVLFYIPELKLEQINKTRGVERGISIKPAYYLGIPYYNKTGTKVPANLPDRYLGWSAYIYSNFNKLLHGNIYLNKISENLLNNEHYTGHNVFGWIDSSGETYFNNNITLSNGLHASADSYIPVAEIVESWASSMRSVMPVTSKINIMNPERYVNLFNKTAPGAYKRLAGFVMVSSHDQYAGNERDISSAHYGKPRYWRGDSLQLKANHTGLTYHKTRSSNLGDGRFFAGRSLEPKDYNKNYFKLTNMIDVHRRVIKKYLAQNNLGAGSEFTASVTLTMVNEKVAVSLLTKNEKSSVIINPVTPASFKSALLGTVRYSKFRFKDSDIYAGHEVPLTSLRLAVPDKAYNDYYMSYAKMINYPRPHANLLMDKYFMKSADISNDMKINNCAEMTQCPQTIVESNNKLISDVEKYNVTVENRALGHIKLNRLGDELLVGHARNERHIDKMVAHGGEWNISDDYGNHVYNAMLRGYLEEISNDNSLINEIENRFDKTGQQGSVSSSLCYYHPQGVNVADGRYRCKAVYADRLDGNVINRILVRLEKYSPSGEKIEDVAEFDPQNIKTVRRW